MSGYYRWIAVSFVVVTGLIALCFWLYLNAVAQLTTQPSQVDISLPQNLSTTMQIGQPIRTQSTGRLSTDINIDRPLQLLLQGKYLARLSFKTLVPIKVRIKYDTRIVIDDHLDIDSSTDLVYQKKYLPQLPVHLNLPLKMSVPFKLDQEFNLMVAIDFDDDVIFDFDELLDLPLKHRFQPELEIDDEMTLQSISSISAELLNRQQHTRAHLKAKVDIPLRNIRPRPDMVDSATMD